MCEFIRELFVNGIHLFARDRANPAVSVMWQVFHPDRVKEILTFKRSDGLQSRMVYSSVEEIRSAGLCLKFSLEFYIYSIDSFDAHLNLQLNQTHDLSHALLSRLIIHRAKSQENKFPSPSV